MHYGILRLQGSGSQIFYACSEAIALEVWHHVAISIDGVHAAMFVDGQRARGSAPLDNAFGPGSTCGDMDGNKTYDTTLKDNEHDWFWGASNHTAGDQPSDPPADANVIGAIDELRFRSGAFTEEEASAVYSHEPL